LFLVEGAAAENWPHRTYYTVIVRPGDTVAEIGARYHVSAASIAKSNEIGVGRPLRSGQVLHIFAATRATRQALLSEALDNQLPNYAVPPRRIENDGSRLATTYPRQPAPEQHSFAMSHKTIAPGATPRFVWPLIGSIISRFGAHGAGERNDGINIAAAQGAPIHAAAAGTVTYAGSELKGYGNLILIAHADGYVTAYAHADSIAVARGARVEQGQIIGIAGETGGVDRPQLHFEIRCGLKPLNPGPLLVASR
jgi:murein DD-endopeptidase MepM/ murein hydrolase activator NlpD